MMLCFAGVKLIIVEELPLIFSRCERLHYPLAAGALEFHYLLLILAGCVFLDNLERHKHDGVVCQTAVDADQHVPYQIQFLGLHDRNHMNSNSDTSLFSFVTSGFIYQDTARIWSEDPMDYSYFTFDSQSNSAFRGRLCSNDFGMRWYYFHY